MTDINSSFSIEVREIFRMPMLGGLHVYGDCRLNAKAEGQVELFDSSTY